MRKLAPVRVSYWGDLLAFTCLHVFCRSLTNTKTSSWINKSYACATRSSLPADRFHTETSGRGLRWHEPSDIKGVKSEF